MDDREGSRAQWPAFLVGCHRSGTTLMRYLLDAHPRLACPPESKFLLGLQPFVAHPQILQGLRSLGCSLDDFLVEFGQLASRILGKYAARAGKARWIDKTPNYYEILPIIDRMFEHKCLFVFIVRHPLDTVASMASSPSFATSHPEDLDIARVVREFGVTDYAWAHHWMRVNGCLTAFAENHLDRSIVLKYEDLVRVPHETMRTVLAFLGEDWSTISIEAAFEMHHTEGYQDWKITKTASVHTSSVGKWRAWAQNDVDELWQIVAPLAERYGYAVD